MGAIDNTLMDRRRVKIYRDGVPIIHATALDETGSKTVTKIPVIGDPDNRVFDGSIELSGSITDIRQDIEGTRLIHAKESAEIDTQEQADLAGVAKDVGKAAVQKTLSTGTTSFEQRFVAVGTKLNSLAVYVARNSTYDVGLKVTVKTIGDVIVGAAFTIPNVNLPTTANWLVYNIPLASKVGPMTDGTTYKIVFENASAPSAGGQLEFYGSALKTLYTIGTGVGKVTNGGFETYTTTPGVPDSWTNNTGAATVFTKETTKIREGTNAVKIAAAGTTADEGLKQALSGLTTGVKYYVEAWARTDGDAGERARLVIRNTTDSLDTISVQGTDAIASYEKLSGTWTAAAGKSYEVWVVHDGTPGATDVVYYDRVSVSQANFALADDAVITGTLRIRLDERMLGVGEDYTLDGTTSPDEVVFTRPVDTGVTIKGTYEFEDANNLVAWRLVMSGSSGASYTMVIETYNTSNVLIESKKYTGVIFSRNGISVPAGGIVEGTLEWEAEDVVDTDS